MGLRAWLEEQNPLASDQGSLDRALLEFLDVLFFKGWNHAKKDKQDATPRARGHKCSPCGKKKRKKRRKRRREEEEKR